MTRSHLVIWFHLGPLILGKERHRYLSNAMSANSDQPGLVLKGMLDDHVPTMCGQ